MKIPGDSFSGIPPHFLWCLGINSFWRQLGSSLKFSLRHLGINSVWRQLRSPLRFASPGDSFSGIPLCFPPLGFTLLIRSQGTTFSPVGGLIFFSFLVELHIFLWCQSHLVKYEGLDRKTLTPRHLYGDIICSINVTRIKHTRSYNIKSLLLPYCFGHKYRNRY